VFSTKTKKINASVAAFKLKTSSAGNG